MNGYDREYDAMYDEDDDTGLGCFFFVFVVVVFVWLFHDSELLQAFLRGLWG